MPISKTLNQKSQKNLSHFIWLGENYLKTESVQKILTTAVRLDFSSHL